MSQQVGKNNNKVYRVVLTGGPCGGKTTAQTRICTFFENLGWKVYRVPETARIIIAGGVKFADLSGDALYQFQENLIRTMIQIEDTFFDLAAETQQNCLVISDRGVMDATAYMESGQWEQMKQNNSWNDVELRDNRYNQVIHLVSAAKGAEAFYTTDANARFEDFDLARQRDDATSQAWVGHPYYDVIDNTTDFESKVVRVMESICQRLNINATDRLSLDSKKRKFLVSCLPEEVSNKVKFQDFIVVHDYLVTSSNNNKQQARIRKRGQNVQWNDEKGGWNLNSGNWTFCHTIRRPKINKERVEVRMQISSREYNMLRAQRDENHYTIYKKRRCFLWNHQYYQMDIYQEPCHPKCKGLIILETYTALGDDLRLPEWLNIVQEITEDSTYSMNSLSKVNTIDNHKIGLEPEKYIRPLTPVSFV